MFSLRQKMLVGFGGLLLIIILLGVRSTMQVTDLGSAIQAILRENYRSVNACQEMKDSLERMNEGALLVLLGNREEGIDAINKDIPGFEKALNIELNNVTLPGEGERAARIQELYVKYKSKIQSMEDKKISHRELSRIYFTGLMPVFHQIKATADEILSMNQQNMYQSSQKAKMKASMARREMSALLFLGAALAFVYVLLIGKWILQPIRRLTASVEEIRRGNLDLVVKSDTRDEIGHLSEAFNEMTESLRELRRSDQARLIRIQHSVQQTFDSLPNAVAIIDLDGHVEMATETARNIFGLKPGVQISGLHFSWLNDLFKDAVTGDIKPGQKKTVPVIQHFYHAEEHYFQPMAVQVLDSFKQVTGMILILNDVTEQLEQDEMKRGFISAVSHQLKTPLTSIQMAVHLLLEEKVGMLNPKQSDLLIAAKEDSERLNGIIEDLLNISRIESGKAAMEIRRASPYRIVADAVESFRKAARSKGVDLSSDLPDDLPDILADMTQIGYVLANLISNALKYTASGGSIVISAEILGDFVWFIVSDTGSGIPEQYLPKIFERFFRVPGQEIQTGTGLGLSIVKEIVEAHGGLVRVESREGRGSAFFISLRRADLT